MAETRPYVLALFDWSAGTLTLRFVKRTSWNRPVPREDESTADPRHAYRWSSRQAARQFLRRCDHLGQRWEVLDLRQVRWWDRK